MEAVAAAVVVVVVVVAAVEWCLCQGKKWMLVMPTVLKQQLAPKSRYDYSREIHLHNDSFHKHICSHFSLLSTALLTSETMVEYYYNYICVPKKH